MNYTKGKWESIGNNPMAYAGIKIRAGDSEIAIVYPYKGESNANLIAAAPDMYEALQLLIKTYWANKGSDGKTCPHPGEFIACITPNGIPDYWRLADKALAKAEGK